MKQITIRDKELNVIDSWDEITVGQYINLMESYSKLGTISDEEFLLEFIGVLTTVDKDFLFDLYEEELTEFVDLVDNFQLEKFLTEDCKTFTFNDRLYSYVPANKLTVGETISLKLLASNNKTQFDDWLNILSIVIRPATETTNEFGEKQYQIEKFNGDIDIINKRKELIKNIPAKNGLHITSAFMNGRK